MIGCAQHEKPGPGRVRTSSVHFWFGERLRPGSRSHAQHPSTLSSDHQLAARGIVRHSAGVRARLVERDRSHQVGGLWIVHSPTSVL